MSKLENNLIHLYQTFFIDQPYSEALKMPLTTDPLSTLPEALQTIYCTIGNVSELMSSEFGHFYSIENVKTNTWHFQCNHYGGFMFGEFGNFCYHFYSQIPTWNKGITDVVTLWNSNIEFEMWSEFSGAETELLYLVVNNAIWNADYLCKVTSRKLIKEYYSILCNEFGMIPFSDGHEQSWMLYSESEHILVRFEKDDKNLLLIASNSMEAIEKISVKYKMKWLKKGGKNEEESISAISDSPLLTASERLDAIYEVCYGKKPQNNQKQTFNQIKNNLQLSFPESLNQYYQLFQNHRLMMDSCCRVVLPSKLAVSTNNMVKVADNFEGDSECFYCISDHMIHVIYENDDTLIYKTDEFVIMLALYQATYVLKSNGLLANNLIPSQLYKMTIDERSWIISKNFKLLGIPFNNTHCLLLAKQSSSLNKAEKQLHLSLSSL